MRGDWDRAIDESMGINPEPYLFEVTEDTPSSCQFVLRSGLNDGSKVIGDMQIRNGAIVIFKENCVHNSRAHVRLKGTPFHAIQPRQDSRTVAYRAKLSELRNRALAGYRWSRRDSQHQLRGNVPGDVVAD